MRPISLVMATADTEDMISLFDYLKYSLSNKYSLIINTFNKNNQKIIFRLGNFSPNPSATSLLTMVEFTYNFTKLLYPIMVSKYLAASSFTPTQCDNLNISKFSAPRVTDRILMPLLVMSVWRSSSVLSFFMYLEKAMYWRVSSPIWLFFLFMELFRDST